MRIDKQKYPQVYLEDCKHLIKKNNVVKFIDVELDLEF